MAERTHHRYGPSTLDSLDLCVRFKFKESEDMDDAATEGTLLHEAFETGNLAGLDEEQRNCVSLIRNYVGALKFEKGMTPADWVDGSEVDIELEGLTYGRADRILFCRKTKRLHVVDAKFTRVSSGHENQLRTYGAAYAEMCNRNEPGSVETVITHVVAPRIGPCEPEEYDAAILIADVRRHIEALYARIEDPFEPPTPNEDLCARCARASRCPALGKVVTTVLKGIGLPLPDVYAPEAIVSLKDRAIVQVLAGAMVNWGEQVKKNNAEFVEASGQDIPGFKVVRRTTGLRVPKDKTAEALKALSVSFGLGDDVALGCCSITVGDVVAAVSLGEGITESEAKERVREALMDIAIEGSCSYLSKEKRLADGVILQRLLVG